MFKRIRQMLTKQAVNLTNGFVYVEDFQGYHKDHVLMMQIGLPATIETLETWSWEPPKAGRFSTSAEELIKVALKHGCLLAILDRREKTKRVPREWSHLPLVRGAEGNY